MEVQLLCVQRIKSYINNNKSNYIFQKSRKVIFYLRGQRKSFSYGFYMDHPGIVLIAPACAMTSENDSTEVFLTSTLAIFGKIVLNWICLTCPITNCKFYRIRCSNFTVCSMTKQNNTKISVLGFVFLPLYLFVDLL